MKKRIVFGILSFAMVVIGGVNMNAQTYGPQKGTKTISMQMGRAESFGNLDFYELNQNTTSYADETVIGTPYSSTYSSYSNSITNMIGVEGKYFWSSLWAARFNGSGAIISSPSQDAVTGVPALEGHEETAFPGTTIKDFRMLEGRTTKQFYLNVGVDRYFPTKYERVFPYVGAQINSTYGQMEIFDGYRGLDSEGEVISTFDTRRGEAYGLGGSLVGGIDYYLAEAFFIGFEVKVCSYLYSVKRVYHQEGMEAQDADTHSTSFLSHPSFKIGFKF
ncbi:hypothetical protein DMA11_20155 [Marinilabiliaceae bacterium JC017]|nr:hypothetical protein DMA11_20155 [Marinilabiliaceae bacterium JC017]